MTGRSVIMNPAVTASQLKRTAAKDQHKGQASAQANRHFMAWQSREGATAPPEMFFGHLLPGKGLP